MNSFRVPYEVKASKFLSFSALAASLPFNRASQRQKIAQPSAFKSLRLAGPRGFGEGSPPCLAPRLLPRLPRCPALLPGLGKGTAVTPRSGKPPSVLAEERYPSPSGGCPGMGSGHWPALFPKLALGRSGLGRAAGPGLFPKRRGAGCGGVGQGGCTGREQVSPLLAPARGVKTQPCANRSPRGGRRPPLRDQALQSPTYRHPSSEHPSGSRTPSPSSSSSWPC